jgi:hypothetical protein
VGFALQVCHHQHDAFQVVSKHSEARIAPRAEKSSNPPGFMVVIDIELWRSTSADVAQTVGLV